MINMPESWLIMDKNFKGKKVLVFGLGLNQGGVGSAKFFASQNAQVLVTDLKTSAELVESLDLLKKFPEITYTLGEHKEEDIEWADLIIKNPAVRPGNKYIEYANELGKEVETDMGIFLRYINPKNIIGVTGTKGKSTTASLIYKILKSTGRDLLFAGNIGKSVLDLITKIKNSSLIILELSSFQLEAFKKHQVSPHIAVITNIYPDHLNYYPSMDEYLQAKKWICQFQTSQDFIFLKEGDQLLDNPKFKAGLQSQIRLFSKDDLPPDFKPTLPGEHNLSNYTAALAVAKIILDSASQEDLWEAMQSFKGVEFRLQLIKEWRGVKIYNDTTATSPQAAIESLKTFKNCIWIGGGVNKNLSYQELAKTLNKYAKKIYFLEGDASEELKKQLTIRYQLSARAIKGTYDNLDKLLADIRKEAKVGDVILFSPGAASFNLFKNEFDRGRKFNKAVARVFKSEEL